MVLKRRSYERLFIFKNNIFYFDFVLIYKTTCYASDNVLLAIPIICVLCGNIRSLVMLFISVIFSERHCSLF